MAACCPVLAVPLSFLRRAASRAGSTPAQKSTNTSREDTSNMSPICAGSGRTPVWTILLSVVVAVGVVAAAGYGLYQFRLRSAMHQARSLYPESHAVSEV